MDEPLLTSSQPGGTRQPTRRWCGPGVAAWVGGGLLLLVVSAAAFAVGLSERDLPFPECRKSAPIAVFTDNSHPDSPLKRQLCGAEDMVMMYGGKGKKTAAFDDLWVLCTKSERWVEIVADGHTHPQGLLEPQTRWKVAHMTGTSGLYIMGGSELYQDSPTANGKDFYNDVWVFSIMDPEGWQLLHAGDNDAANKKKKTQGLPEQRRAHVGIMYQHQDGHDEMIIHGGRSKAGEVLNDVWAFNTGKKEWTLLGDWADDSPDAPAPRKGHIAIVAPSPNGKKPYLVIHGGRPEVGYYGDVWAFDLNTLEWEEWYGGSADAEDDAPAPRDHHVGHYFDQTLFIHGGRGGFGRVWANASHFDDLWKFDIPTRTWTELEPAGPKPLARWLHTSTGYAYHHVERIQPAVAENNMFVVSGGEDLRRCYMNDVWAYDVRANTWDAIQECTFCQNSCKLDARGNAAPLSAAATA
mmetsp:Transcript_40259/g.101905  ORF Transcript_40259/g.101905 Transcript_40259/m.101905 type:complete len:466 (+) Transcript_40259:177-1574(+)